MFRSIARHSAELAGKVVEVGAVGGLVQCLNDSDPSVKEMACWTICYIVKWE